MGLSMSEIRKGDTVRLLPDQFEAQPSTTSNLVDLYEEDGTWAGTVRLHQVEKVEPPVEVFGRGDIVRSKSGGHVYLITSEGYVEMNENIRGYANPPATFTSKGYEKINLVEAPF